MRAQATSTLENLALSAKLDKNVCPVFDAAIPPLIERLSDPDPSVRILAPAALGRIGKQPDKVVPALARLLSDQHEDVRWCAASALGDFGKAAGGALPELKRALGDSYALVRQDAANALGNIGRSAASAAPTLAKMAADEKESEDVRKAAAEALKKIRGEKTGK